MKSGHKTGSGAGDSGAESLPENVNMLVPIFIKTENNQVYLPQFSASFTFRISNKMMTVLLSGMKV